MADFLEFLELFRTGEVAFLGADPEELARLLLAAFLGGLIGIEREVRNQPAGFRTHLILCTGSALVMLVSVHVSRTYAVPGQPGSDPTRIAAQVVSGIGFLGAGAIMRFGATVKGLTTATSLWSCAGVGLAVGSGYYAGGLLVAVVMLLALSILSRFERAFLAGKGTRSVVLSAAEAGGLIGTVDRSLTEIGGALRSVQLEHTGVGDRAELRALVDVPAGVSVADLADRLAGLDGVLGVEIQ